MVNCPPCMSMSDVNCAEIVVKLATAETDLGTNMGRGPDTVASMN